MDHQHQLVWLAILLLTTHGLVFAGGYGESIDEPRHVQYGRQIVEVYQGSRAIEDTNVDPLEHGPFYSFLSYVVGSRMTALRPGWISVDGRHFAYYLSFILATVCLGWLVNRYTRPLIAWLTAGLFFTQPLLYGHAFINPKDTPFMAFFLATLTFGVLALDSASTKQGSGNDPPRRTEASAPARDRKTRWLVGLSLGALISLALLWLWHGLLPSMEALLDSAYRGQAPWLVQALFHAVATDAYKTPLDLYIAKLDSAFIIARGGMTLLLVLGLVMAWTSWLATRLAPFFRPYRGYFFAAGAGLLLGLDTSIRAAAPFAAVPLLILYWLYAGSRKRALGYGLILFVTSIAACLATWPFLWKDTIQRYIESIATLSHFPWQGVMLFNGQIITAGHQPWYYIPVLMLLQLTLPVLILAALGAWRLWRTPRAAQDRVEIALLLITFAIPIAASLRPGTIIYNNFRQLLFTVPGFFLLGALGLAWTFRRLGAVHWQALLAAVVLLPGIIGIVRLHPYEYMYYNALAGIGGDTYSRFESDYWCTSYGEAMGWVNQHAEPKATIAVGGSGIPGQVYEFARSDILVIRLDKVNASNPASMAVICDGKGGQRALMPGLRTLMIVEHAGVTLAEVKALGPNP